MRNYDWGPWKALDDLSVVWIQRLPDSNSRGRCLSQPIAPRSQIQSQTRHLLSLLPFDLSVRYYPSSRKHKDSDSYCSWKVHWSPLAMESGLPWVLFPGLLRLRCDLGFHVFQTKVNISASPCQQDPLPTNLLVCACKHFVGETDWWTMTKFPSRMASWNIKAAAFKVNIKLHQERLGERILGFQHLHGCKQKVQ